MPVLVPHCVGPKVLRHLAEHELALGRPAGTRHPGGGVDHHLARRVDQSLSRKRQQREQGRRRIAPGIRHQFGGGHAGPRHLGQPVDGFWREAEIGRQVHGALAGRPRRVDVPPRHAVRERGKHDLGAVERRVIRTQQAVAQDELAG